MSVHACLFFRSQNRFQENPDSYNGAVRENYSWSQDYSDVEVRVFVPKTVIKGRQVNVHLICWECSFFPHRVQFSLSHVSPVCQVTVSLLTNSVKVCVRDGAEEKTLMEGELTNKINTENSLWSLEPGNCVIVSTHTHVHTQALLTTNLPCLSSSCLSVRLRRFGGMPC